LNLQPEQPVLPALAVLAQALPQSAEYPAAQGAKKRPDLFLGIPINGPASKSYIKKLISWLQCPS
jgi:hypothetical protein